MATYLETKTIEITVITLSDGDKSRLERLEWQGMLAFMITAVSLAISMVWGVPFLFIRGLQKFVGMEWVSNNSYIITSVAFGIAILGCLITAFIITKVTVFFEQKEEAILRRSGWKGEENYRIE